LPGGKIANIQIQVILE